MSSCNHKMTEKLVFGDCEVHGMYEFKLKFCSICGMTEGEIELKAENEELKKLADHGNGEVLLGWMDAHRKSMDNLEESERKVMELEKELDLIKKVAIHNNEGNCIIPSDILRRSKGNEQETIPIRYHLKDRATQALQWMS